MYQELFVRESYFVCMYWRIYRMFKKYVVLVLSLFLMPATLLSSNTKPTKQVMIASVVSELTENIIRTDLAGVKTILESYDFPDIKTQESCISLAQDMIVEDLKKIDLIRTHGMLFPYDAKKIASQQHAELACVLAFSAGISLAIFTLIGYVDYDDLPSEAITDKFAALLLHTKSLGCAALACFATALLFKHKADAAYDELNKAAQQALEAREQMHQDTFRIKQLLYKASVA